MEYSNSKKNILLPLIVAVALIAGIIIGITIDRVNIMRRFNNVHVRGLSEDKISTVMSLIKTQYVDNVNLDSVAEAVIPVILENLDPHSTYISASELADINEPLEGQFEGIGITFNMMTDTVMVMSVISGGPSYKAGIQNGDRIITINDSIVAGKKIAQHDIVKKLRGERGSKVDLGIERSGISGLIPITVTRDVIPVKSLDAYFMVEPGVGYIKLSRFSRNSHKELVEAANKLKAQGMQRLIFDLRGNSGGFLDQAILIANEFLPANALIVYTEGHSRRRNEQLSSGKGSLTDIPLAVLIDEGSASASEIVAGALQDNDRGTIVGRRSFGKGLVQEQIPFSDGSAIRLTVARYYTPLGRSIQKPYNNGIAAYNSDLEARYAHKEYFSADSIKFADSLRFITPGGKIVYGGGGIMPDVFVGADTIGFNRYTREIFGRNILLKYSFQYADRHRAQLNKIEDISQMKNFFEQQKGLFDDFISYAARNGITPKGHELAESKYLILNELKAYIARATPLEDTGFFQILIPSDTVIKKTLRIFQ